MRMRVAVVAGDPQLLDVVDDAAGCDTAEIGERDVVA